MRKSSSQKGNTTVLVIVLVGVLALAIGFFALNYGQLFGTHKEAQTAIDAAALQAAKDIGRIVITDPILGQVALTDDMPQNNNFNNRPILGVNTILATARLDLLIAEQLQNTTMIFLARRDVTNCQNAARTLANAITAAAAGTPARDRNNNPIDLIGNATQAYDINSRRLGKGNRQGNLTITVGQLAAGQGFTNIPVPRPYGMSRVNSNQYYDVGGNRFYRPYINLPVSGVNFTFAAVADEPRLVDAPQFQPLQNGMIPAVVRVQATETVASVAPNSTDGGRQMTGTMRVTACAQTGGRRFTFPSGVFSIEFPQGFPGSQSPVDFTSVNSIMNAAQLSSSADENTPSPRAPWAARGQYLQAVGGPVPRSTQGNAPGSLVRMPYNGRRRDNPSVGLAFEVYDWLKACGLRPNIQAVTGALTQNIRTWFNNNGNGSGQTYSAMHNGMWFGTPAYAQTTVPGTDTPVALGAIVDMETNPDVIEGDSNSDPRDLRNYAPGSQLEEQMYTAWQYTPAGAVLDDVPGARRTALDAQGNAVTTDGHSVSDLFGLREQILKMDETGKKIYQVALEAANSANNDIQRIEGEKLNNQSQINNYKQQIRDLEAQIKALSPNDTETKTKLEADIASLNEKIAALEADSQSKDTALNDAKGQKQRAEAVKTNANYATLVAVQMQNNAGVLTGQGAQMVTPTHFILMGDTHFYPPSETIPTVAQIKGKDPIPTGQEGGAQGAKDWAAIPDGQNTTDFTGGTSKNIFCKRTTAPVIGKRPDKGDLFFQPVLAQASTTPFQSFNFQFNIIGDASKDSSGGSVRMQAVTRSPFTTMNTLEGQTYFQALNSLSTPSGNNAAVVWSVAGRDLNGNRNQAASYYGDVNADGYSVPNNWCGTSPWTYPGYSSDGGNCYHLVSQWQLNSPMPVCTGASANNCCDPTFTQSADGTVVASYSDCPPPPPRGH